MINFSLPESAAYILQRLTESGHAAYLVGGCVRDTVVGRQVHDWDVATSAAPVDVAVLFPKTVLTGEKFGTVTVLIDGDAVEVTTFRVEGEYHDSRRPESVEFVSNLDEDLSRRDFTMNAMAISVTRRLIDPFGGIKDIKKRIIRCVGDPNKRFSEDALRMFRAFRFSAQLGFMIGNRTMRAIHANADSAKLISAERVRVELEKTLMSQRPEIIGDMIKAGLLARYTSMSSNKPIGLEKIEELPMEPTVRWCALCAILLKEHSITSAMEFLHSLYLDGKTTRTCVRALSISCFPCDQIEIKHLFIEYGVDATRCAAAVFDIMANGLEQGSGLKKQRDSSSAFPDKIEDLSPCLAEPSTCYARVNEIIASGECFSLSKLAVSGSDLIALGHSPGQELGEMLDMLLNHVIEHPKDNTREVLLGVSCGRFS